MQPLRRMQQAPFWQWRCPACLTCVARYDSIHSTPRLITTLSTMRPVVLAIDLEFVRTATYGTLCRSFAAVPIGHTHHAPGAAASLPVFYCNLDPWAAMTAADVLPCGWLRAGRDRYLGALDSYGVPNIFSGVLVPKPSMMPAAATGSSLMRDPNDGGSRARYLWRHEAVIEALQSTGDVSSIPSERSEHGQPPVAKALADYYGRSSLQSPQEAMEPLLKRMAKCQCPTSWRRMYAFLNESDNATLEGCLLRLSHLANASGNALVRQHRDCINMMNHESINSRIHSYFDHCNIASDVSIDKNNRNIGDNDVSCRIECPDLATMSYVLEVFCSEASQRGVNMVGYGDQDFQVIGQTLKMWSKEMSTWDAHAPVNTTSMGHHCNWQSTVSGWLTPRRDASTGAPMGDNLMKVTVPSWKIAKPDAREWSNAVTYIDAHRRDSRGDATQQEAFRKIFGRKHTPSLLKAAQHVASRPSTFSNTEPLRRLLEAPNQHDASWDASVLGAMMPCLHAASV